MSILEGLNPEQREAACHGRSPLLIIAGAGSGKTTTLVHRVAQLVESGVAPQKILLLTYTRRAATMMTERTRKLLGESSDVSNIWSGTFHAISVRLLRTYNEAIGLPPYFTVHDRSDSEELLERLLQQAKTDGRSILPKKNQALSIHSYQVNSQWPLERVLEEQYPEFEKQVDQLRRLFEEYQQQKRTLGIADYDDLLLLMRDMVQHEKIGPHIAQRFRAVLVDEYQDTNVLQSQILTGLCPGGEGLTAVGDDAQSIYSFRAATVRNILDFPKQYPGTKIVKLEQNYRSTVPILSVSNALITQARESFEKQLWSDRQEGAMPQLVQCDSEANQADFIVRRILRHKAEGIPLRQQAVLFRAGHHSTVLETELMRNKINFVKYGGLKFAEAAHVKDLLAFLRLAENQKDTVAALRLLLLLPGIGDRRAAQALDLLGMSSTGVEIWRQMKPPSATGKLWNQLVDLISRLAAGRPSELMGQLTLALEFYQPLLELKHDNFQQRLSDLQQLLAMADRFESRQQMLVDLTLDPPTNTEELPIQSTGKKPKEPPLVLSTVHSAKGLEWPVVYVMSAMEGCMPLPRAAATSEGYEEERRLLYVAMTRAADYLYVSYNSAIRDNGFGFGYRRGYAPPAGGLCEYLKPRDVRQLFQEQTAVRWQPLEFVS